MSIEKFNPRIVGEAIPYTQVNTKVVQNITDMEAGFVWIYLLTLPPDWTVVKEHIKKHFDIGRDKIKKIFAYLNRCGLIEYVQSRTPDGRMHVSEIRVLNGSKFKDVAKEKVIHTGGLKNRPPVNQACGKQPTTNKTTKQKKQKAEKKEARAHLFPDEFYPSERNIELAKEFNLDLNYYIEKVRDWSKANGSKKLNWQATLNNWLRGDNERKKGNGSFQAGNQKNEIHSTVKFFDDPAYTSN